MLGLNTWDLFGFVAFIFLIIFFYAEDNTVWAAFTLGVIVSLVVSVIYLIKDGSWPWGLFKKILTTVTLCGVLFELFGKLKNALKK
jgi:hypothetical protein